MDHVNDSRDVAPSASRRLSIVALAFALAGPALLYAAWTRPIAGAPSELLPLALPPSLVREQLARDAADAAHDPDSEIARRRRELFRESNAREVSGGEFPNAVEARRTRLLESLRELEASHGAEGVAAARATDVARMEAAIHGELGSSDTRAALGGFVRMMERYDMASGGRQLAPRFVVRTAFKARWNAAHQRELTADLSPIELRAYWGWLALEARSAPLELRLEALGPYGEAGGPAALESRGILLAEAARLPEAEEAFLAAYESRHAFRDRNYAVYAGSRDPGEEP
ncbi:MAG: hypothetical protein AB7S26_34000 [Sandaracinaceae bacterium]